MSHRFNLKLNRKSPKPSARERTWRRWRMYRNIQTSQDKHFEHEVKEVKHRRLEWLDRMKLFSKPKNDLQTKPLGRGIKTPS